MCVKSKACNIENKISLIYVNEYINEYINEYFKRTIR